MEIKQAISLFKKLLKKNEVEQSFYVSTNLSSSNEVKVVAKSGYSSEWGYDKLRKDIEANGLELNVSDEDAFNFSNGSTTYFLKVK